jgi:hypothetical protein
MGKLITNFGIQIMKSSGKEKRKENKKKKKEAYLGLISQFGPLTPLPRSQSEFQRQHVAPLVQSSHVDH